MIRPGCLLTAMALCLGTVPGMLQAQEPKPLVLPAAAAEISSLPQQVYQPVSAAAQTAPQQQPNWVVAPPNESPLYQLRFQGGVSYFDYSRPPLDAKTGGTYGLDGIVDLTGEIGAYGAARFNHVSEETQFLGTLGLYKSADGTSSETLDRLGASIMINEFLSSNYDGLAVTQFRTQVGYMLTENTAAGIRYTNQIDEDRINLGGVSAPFGVTQTVAAYVSRYSDNNFSQLMVGHNFNRESVFLNGFIRRSLADNLYAFADVYYEDVGSWSGVVGLEYRFGSGPVSRNGSHASPFDDPTIGHSFISGESRFFHNDTEIEIPAMEYEVPE